jgi:hypothetical protein
MTVGLVERRGADQVARPGESALTTSQSANSEPEFGDAVLAGHRARLDGCP